MCQWPVRAPVRQLALLGTTRRSTVPPDIRGQRSLRRRRPAAWARVCPENVMTSRPCIPLTGRRQRTSSRLFSYRRPCHTPRKAVACAAAAFRTAVSSRGEWLLCAVAALTNWQ
eukprot:229460-Chlamydomonas_euryale.AAC.1